ncbi:hypothetical protein DFH07DRAFT_777196 [Mycena maculata]|uniref:Uncharacterized protein n=1 Tax=Mycena maculata TaxID=230809 RepID=A0AAD7IK32_9AGAR|nr:hypothetical protein DFH07DRAFT_777196 [Mycena maculata]
MSDLHKGQTHHNPVLQRLVLKVQGGRYGRDEVCGSRISKEGEDLKYTCKLVLRTLIFLDATLTKGLNDGATQVLASSSCTTVNGNSMLKCVQSYDDEESEDDLLLARKHFDQWEWWLAKLQQTGDGKSGVTALGHLPLYTVCQTSFDHNKLPWSLLALNYGIHGNKMTMIHVLFQILILCSTSPSAFETAIPDQWELSWS